MSSRYWPPFDITARYHNLYGLSRLLTFFWLVTLLATQWSFRSISYSFGLHDSWWVLSAQGRDDAAARISYNFLTYKTHHIAGFPMTLLPDIIIFMARNSMQCCQELYLIFRLVAVCWTNWICSLRWSSVWKAPDVGSLTNHVSAACIYMRRHKSQLTARWVLYIHLCFVKWHL